MPVLFVLLVLFLLALAGGGWRWLKTSLPETAGETKALGLTQPVTIARNNHGIPFIRAQSERDAYFALGYAHAQDRLWQMDMQRRIASGRLSEIAGKAGLGNDRFFRVLGLERQVESSMAGLDEATSQILIAYAAGINAWIGQLRLLPPEFLLAGVAPRPWRPSDSLLWGRVMALQLAGNWRDELLNLSLIERLGVEKAGQLSAMLNAPAPEKTAAILEAQQLLAALPPESQASQASNAWVVSGARSSTGAPLLANDPHLSFRAPILWYLASLEAPGISIQGATVPGMPFVLLGQNNHLAWGLTSVNGDTMDLFVETPDPQDKLRYLTPGGSEAFTTRRETIAVKGESDVVLVVRESRHGPIVSDILGAREAPAGTILALASTALNASDTTAAAFRRMSQAVDAASFRSALESIQAPPQHVMYATKDGTIGYQMTGHIPLRPGKASPDLPRPGADGTADWNGFVPFGDMPHQINPENGVLLNANNRPVGPDYPHHLASAWPEPLRAERLKDLLEAKPLHGPDDMNAYQMDSLSMAFMRLKPLLMTADPASDQGRKVIALLKDWDGSMARDLGEPLLFSAWAEELQRILFAGRLGPLFDSWSNAIKPLVIEMALQENAGWCDDDNTKDKTESCPETITRALDEALRRLGRDFGQDMSRWRWKDAHKAKFQHGILERLPIPEEWVAPSIDTDGDGFSLNRGSFSFGSFRHFHGAGLRAVFDLKTPSASRYIIATGQSGNPFSPHYADLIGMWRDGQSLKLDAEGKMNELILWPAQ
ncbi:MAG: penicillin acylase family protein [Alphaproteobacteria bacterium]|nr:penicillin acylase family protein [Alphaproteobacteria bacterium]